MRLRFACALAVTLTVSSALDAQPPPKDSWRAFETDYFQFYSNAPRGRTRELVESFGRLHSLITKGGREGLEATPVTVFVFKSERSMEPYLRSPPQAHGIVTSWESFHAGDRLWLILNADISDDVRFLAYEAYVSNYLYARMPELPYWARHGLASFYAGFRDKKGTEVAVGLPRPQHLRTLRASTLMPWRQFFLTGGDSAVVDQARTLGLFNAQAWIAAHFLMTGGSKPDLGGKFFGPLREGRSEEVVLRDLYGWDLDEFGNEIRNYFHAPALPYFPWDVGELDPGEIFQRDLGRPELLYNLAKYLVEAHHPPPLAFTEAHLASLADDPQYAAKGRALQARLQLEVGDRQAGKRLFEQALADPAAGVEEWLAYASFLAETDAPEPELRQAAMRALELGAKGPTARALLGQTLTSVPESDEQIGLFRSALGRSGGSLPHVAHNLALGLVRRGEYESALGVIEENLRPYDAADAEEMTQLVLHNQLVGEVNAATSDGDLEAAISAYDEGIPLLADEEVKRRFSEARDQLRQRVKSDRQWQAMGEAVDLANARRYDEARNLLRSTLAEGVVDERLRAEMESLLERLGS